MKQCSGPTKFDTSTYRRSIDQPTVVDSASTALEALNWHGMFNTDWICDDAGVDLPWLWYQISAGIIPDVSKRAESDVHVRWLVGDGIALVERLLTGKFRQALGALRPIPGCRHDDFSLADPLPLFGEAADYFAKFVASRGSVRPVTEGMVR